jgi:hypothetical protein
LSQIPGEKSSVSPKFFLGLEFFRIFHDNRAQGQEMKAENLTENPMGPDTGHGHLGGSARS